MNSNVKRNWFRIKLFSTKYAFYITLNNSFMVFLDLNKKHMSLPFEVIPKGIKWDILIHIYYNFPKILINKGYNAYPVSPCANGAEVCTKGTWLSFIICGDLWVWDVGLWFELWECWLLWDWEVFLWRELWWEWLRAECVDDCEDDLCLFVPLLCRPDLWFGVFGALEVCPSCPEGELPCERTLEYGDLAFLSFEIVGTVACKI